MGLYFSFVFDDPPFAPVEKSGGFFFVEFNVHLLQRAIHAHRELR
jgi:hypothetical protein